ncbi:MAG TPA: hydrogenase 3 maturation endopeptidase HyCI [Candidatus Bathyarchaeia archaeon]|nr:hydrogenase 3 maturation endopeptidase HyCI [Candidatus Bathyarchaeia archaeon]
MTKSGYDFREELKKWLTHHGKTVVAGIGNPIRMDDFVGVKIVQDLQGKVPKNVHLIECETVPESFMDEIVELQPSHVLLIDAAVMGLKPGEVRLLYAEKVTIFPAISTHMLPLRVFCEYITQLTNAKIALLLIEPKSVEFREGLTPEVASSEELIVGTLLKLLSQL